MAAQVFLPMADEMPDITELLQQWTAGDRTALEQVIPLVYNQLRSIAEHQLRGEKHSHTRRTNRAGPRPLSSPVRPARRSMEGPATLFLFRRHDDAPHPYRSCPAYEERQARRRIRARPADPRAAMARHVARGNPGPRYRTGYLESKRPAEKSSCVGVSRPPGMHGSRNGGTAQYFQSHRRSRVDARQSVAVPRTHASPLDVMKWRESRNSSSRLWGSRTTRRRDRWLEEQSGRGAELLESSISARSPRRQRGRRTAALHRPLPVGTPDRPRRNGRSVARLALPIADSSGEWRPKLVLSGIAGEVLLPRFRRERQLLARLNHPCIAGLLDGGFLFRRTSGLVMEYVEGEPPVRFLQPSST